MQFPNIRMRINRHSKFIRNLTAENQITTSDLVYPIFVIDGINHKEEIPCMMGQFRVSINNLLLIVEECERAGIIAIALFPCVSHELKNVLASESYNDDGLIQRAIKAVKQRFPEMGIFTDIALDPYTLSGQDGIIDENGKVLNDYTNEILVKQALSHVYAGADFVAPSDMMDGRIGKIRKAFESNNLHDKGIMAYTAKYASNFYGPFRQAVGSDKQLCYNKCHNKLSYQMNPANANEAIIEAELDYHEGADILMIKPGMAYLDIIYRIKQHIKRPVATYHVSGEYAMLKLASQAGYINYEHTLLEIMLCFKRAGADIIWTYAALDIARFLSLKLFW